MDRVIDGRYRIIEPIGAGGSAQVYRAQDTGLGREVAIKLLDPQAAAENTVRKFFVKEARALAQLSHPNIVAVHDVGEVDHLPYIVMEYVAGSSLKESIERNGAMPVVDAVNMAIEIAQGLQAAHSRGIVHADLKPSNVLLDQNGKPKICDFGIARTPQEEADTPQVFATALYVAPERVEGKQASVSSDIYGLGLVLYEMLVGKPPFTSSNPAVLLRDHVVRQPVPPSHLRPSLPKELDSIVLKALAKDPALRFRRAADLGHALSRLENIGMPLATTRIQAGTIMTAPIAGFVPSVEQSPVVALLTAYGRPIRHAFFGTLTALPLLGLLILADVNPFLSLLIAGLVLAIALLGQIGLALAFAWLGETALIFLFLPALAVVFAGMGLWLWLREYPAERSALALAMPVAAPFGLAPALVLTSAAVHGLSGVVTVAWGATLTVVYAVAAGRQVLGPYVQTGLTLEQVSLFSTARAIETKAALLTVLQPSASTPDRWAPLFAMIDPNQLWAQLSGLVSRLSGADVTAVATVLAWTMAALVVWTITRLLRSFFDTLLRRPKRWFALYVFATAVGVVSGAMLLYMLFVTWAPLAFAAGRPSDSILFLAAVTGAAMALAIGVVISATETQESRDEVTPPMAARRLVAR
ncbi:MAG: serine/threonine-protein kinase [Candidatus Limnocylindria bacterium]